MAKAEWKSELSLGLEKIDGQHQKFLTLINDFYDGVRSAGSLESGLELLFDKIEKYSKQHFKSEELLFQKIKYPEAEEHTRIHREFSKEMDWFKGRLHEGNVVVAVGIIDHLEKWLLNHIADMDSRYAKWMKQNNVAYPQELKSEEGEENFRKEIAAAKATPPERAGKSDQGETAAGTVRRGNRPVIEEPVHAVKALKKEMGGELPVSAGKSGLMGKSEDYEHSQAELIKEKIGARIYKTIEQFYNGMKEIQSAVPLSRREYNRATEMVDFAYRSEQRMELISGISLLRDAEDYMTYHSISVFLTLVEVMIDLKSRQNRIEFYEVFKQVNRNVNFNPQSIRKMGVAALLHDHGLMHIDRELLNKPGSLTPEEFQEVKRHPRIAVEELFNIGIKDMEILEVIGNHHSKYPVFNRDGQSVIAQILNMIDIYDACSSNRGYNTAMPYNSVRTMLSNEMLIANWDRTLYGMVISGTIDRIAVAKSKLAKAIG